MKIIKLSTATLATSFLLMACQPEPRNALAQQQHFICKSLIEGFLKTQQLGQYQLQQIQPSLQQSVVQRRYQYRISSDHQMRINMPQQHDLNFQCDQTSAQHFELKLLNHAQQNLQNLLSLDVPSQHTMNHLTAFALKTQ